MCTYVCLHCKVLNKVHPLMHAYFSFSFWLSKLHKVGILNKQNTLLVDQKLLPSHQHWLYQMWRKMFFHTTWWYCCGKYCGWNVPIISWVIIKLLLRIIFYNNTIMLYGKTFSFTPVEANVDDLAKPCDLPIIYSVDWESWPCLI